MIVTRRRLLGSGVAGIALPLFSVVRTVTEEGRHVENGRIAGSVTVRESSRFGPPTRVSDQGKMGAITQLTDGRMLSVFDHARPVDKENDVSIPQQTFGRFSTDAGVHFGEPHLLFTHPEEPGSANNSVPLGDRDGSIHIFGIRNYNMPSGPKAKGDDFFKSRGEIWYTVSRDQGKSWDRLRHIDYGPRYTGSLNSVIQLGSGRILLPVCYLSRDRPTGVFVTSAVFSDDGGKTWKKSKNDVLVDSGGQAIESGAIEPVTVELADGRVWMVIRTQTSYLFESYSSDGGETWGLPQRTLFRSSNSPGGLVRLKAGSLVLVWNNEIGEPLRDGGVSYSRQSMVMAINDGLGWKGYREIAPPFGPEDDVCAATAMEGHTPSEGWATYPYPIETGDGNILVGYGEMRRGNRKRTESVPISFPVVRVDPQWLLQTEVTEDFSDGLKNFQLAGTRGVRVLVGPNGHQALRLQKTRRDWPSGVTWNFPFGKTGYVRMLLQVQPGFAGVYFTLSEYFLRPCNRQGGSFRWMIGSDLKFRSQWTNEGPYLKARGPWTIGEFKSEITTSQTHEISVRWDCNTNVAELRLDGHFVATLVGVEPSSRGICYMRLYSAATTTDNKGLWVMNLQCKSQP